MLNDEIDQQQLFLVLLITTQELPMTSKQKVAIVTGGNSGIGRATVMDGFILKWS
jgi:hypothetical protein